MFFKYYDIKDIEYNGNKIKQHFNNNWNSVVVLDLVFKYMLNNSVQHIVNDIIELEEYNYFAFVKTKDLELNINFTVNYRKNGVAIDNLLEEIQKKILEEADEELKKIKEQKRKEQKKYFAIQAAQQKKGKLNA